MKTYQAIGGKMEGHFGRVYEHAARVAEALNVQPSTPRVVGRQIHRTNAPADTPEEHYRRNVAVPFINHIHTEIESQFSANVKL